MRPPGTITQSFTVPPTCDGRIQRLYDYWRSIHPEAAGLPGRQHLEPLDFPELLRWLWLVDVLGTPPRFRYRLIGTGHTRVMERDLTGHWLDDAYDRFTDTPDHADFLAVADGEIRYCRRAPQHRVEKGHVVMERLLLPLARDGANVDMVLGIALYTREDGTVA